ncbi:hypothetical protein B0J17DRAFT_174584 [Rhizoctonia solani]|nr:hypothetical protein B0J17DRAFT_174584 [Rhizoctonia solani]
MVANEPHSPTSPNGHIQFRPAMSEQEALQIQREAYALATAKKEADEQRRALHAQATARGITEEEKRRRILAYMSYAGESEERMMTMIWMKMKTRMTCLESMRMENWTWRRMSMGWAG